MAEKKKAEEIDEIEEINAVDLDGNIPLNTHELINRNYSGHINVLKEGYAKVSLLTSDDMGVDSYGLVHGGFIFSAADFAAMAAVNDPNVVLAGATSSFLSPVRANDEVIFIAKVRHKEGRQREVNVTGYVLEIKVFEGLFKTVVLDKHILKLDLMNAIKGEV